MSEGKIRRGVVPVRVAFASLTLCIAATLNPAAAKPVELRCVIADEAQTDGPSRTIAVRYDEQAKTLEAQDGDKARIYRNVTISTVSINGSDDETTIGIDRSSSSIAFQTYRSDRIVTEIGSCKPAPG